jgi:hypothetical protein
MDPMIETLEGVVSNPGTNSVLRVVPLMFQKMSLEAIVLVFRITSEEICQDPTENGETPMPDVLS